MNVLSVSPNAHVFHVETFSFIDNYITANHEYRVAVGVSS